MKQHTTNYQNTFIEVAADCPAEIGQIPKSTGEKKTVAEMQYETLQNNPYKFTSDDVLFQVFADRKDLIESEYQLAREVFFSKGQACFRASPLTKRFGFGVHANEEGKIAIYGRESLEYEQFVNDNSIKKVKAMRTQKSN
jgi:hypothetical protein